MKFFSVIQYYCILYLCATEFDVILLTRARIGVGHVSRGISNHGIILATNSTAAMDFGKQINGTLYALTNDIVFYTSACIGWYPINYA